MFDPTKEVPNFELCLKLRELGYPQSGGGWYWIYDKHLGEIENLVLIYEMTSENIEHNAKYGYLYVKAPTVYELGEMLPVEVNLPEGDALISIDRPNNTKWLVSYCLNGTNFYPIRFDATSEANARAKLVIWLLENKHVILKKEQIKKEV